jgi:enhancing lycopene biosynthesis protein 2
VLTLLALDEHQATILCCAPNIPQAGVIDHRSQQPAAGDRSGPPEQRNVLTESARIARGAIRDVATVRAGEIDALILPGGYGAAKNLCNFAEKGAACDVHPAVEQLIGDCLAQRKPIGAICIAPALVARVAGKRGIAAKLTIGNDPATAKALTATGCTHEVRPVNEITVDTDHRIVSTPAYMLGPGPAAVNQGIRKLVEQVLRMI